MEKIKERYDFVDLLKVIAIIMVIILHSVQLRFDFISINEAKTYILFLARLLCEGVPIFVCINGFLIINKEFELKKHIKKTLKMFILLIVWCIIDIILIKLIRQEDLQLKTIIENVFLTNISNIYTGPLWFLQNLIMLYLIFPALKVVHDNNKKVYNYIFILVCFFSVGMNLIGNIIIILENVTYLKLNMIYSFLDTYNPISNGNFIFFFMLGGYIFENKEKFQVKKYRIISMLIGCLSVLMIFALGVVVSKIQGKVVSGGFNYSTIFSASIITALFAIFYNYKNKKHIYNRLIMDLGKNSLGIYLVHKISIIIIYKYVNMDQTWIQKILIPIIVLAVSYIIVKVIKKIPVIHKIMEL